MAFLIAATSTTASCGQLPAELWMGVFRALDESNDLVTARCLLRTCRYFFTVGRDVVYAHVSLSGRQLDSFLEHAAGSFAPFARTVSIDLGCFSGRGFDLGTWTTFCNQSKDLLGRLPHVSDLSLSLLKVPMPIVFDAIQGSLDPIAELLNSLNPSGGPSLPLTRLAFFAEDWMVQHDQTAPDGRGVMCNAVSALLSRLPDLRGLELRCSFPGREQPTRIPDTVVDLVYKSPSLLHVDLFSGAGSVERLELDQCRVLSKGCPAFYEALKTVGRSLRHLVLRPEFFFAPDETVAASPSLDLPNLRIIEVDVSKLNARRFADKPVPLGPLLEVLASAAPRSVVLVGKPGAQTQTLLHSVADCASAVWPKLARSPLMIEGVACKIELKPRRAVEGVEAT